MTLDHTSFWSLLLGTHTVDREVCSDIRRGRVVIGSVINSETPVCSRGVLNTQKPPQGFESRYKGSRSKKTPILIRALILMFVPKYYIVGFFRFVGITHK